MRSYNQRQTVPGDRFVARANSVGVMPRPSSSFLKLDLKISQSMVSSVLYFLFAIVLASFIINVIILLSLAFVKESLSCGKENRPFGVDIRHLPSYNVIVANRDRR